METNKCYLGDSLELMKDIPDNSVDMILADLPYGTTACKWDVIIPFDKLWEQYNRIIKDNAAIVLTASQPFTSVLVASNIKNFKCEWIWVKNAGSNFATVKFMPMKEHENVLVFGKGKLKYNPQMQERAPGGKERVKTVVNCKTKTDILGGKEIIKDNNMRPELRYPSSVQKFNRERGLHPTQKPVKLFEYLIRTYTNENDVVLDNCAGSMTTAIACIRTNRKYICMEKEKKYFDIGINRIEEESHKLF